MISSIKSLFRLMTHHRKNIFIIFIFTCLFVLIRFPWSESVEKIVRNIKSEIRLPINIDFKRVDFGLFSPHLSFHELQINNKAFQDSLDLDQLKISLALTKWLALRPGYHLEIKKDKTHVFLTLWTQKKKVKDIKGVYRFIKGSIPFLNLAHLQSLSRNIQAEGEAQIKLDLHFNEKDPSLLEGSVLAEGFRVKFQKFQIITPMGPLRLPSIKWKKAKLKLRFEEQQMIIEQMQLGTSDDSFFVQLRGFLAFSFARRFRIETYDLQTQINTNQNFRLDLLDLMLSSTKTETRRGYRYQARIYGSKEEGSNIEKISAF